MLAVARAVLMKVHSGVFAALAAPPVAGPNGEPVYSNWDVRHVLGRERRKVTSRRPRTLPCEKMVWRSSHVVQLSASDLSIRSGKTGDERTATSV